MPYAPVYKTALKFAQRAHSAYDHNVWITIGWAACVTWACIRLLMPWANRLKLLDVPDIDRKTHPNPTPVLGTALCVGAVCALWTQPISEQTLVLAMGAVGMWVLGTLDDIKGRPALLKLLVQMFIVAATVAVSGMHFEAVSIGSWRFELGVLAIPWTVLWLTTLTNAINLIDGSDGLAVGVALLMAAALGAFTQSTWAFALVGACVVFWWHNKPVAKCFLGDGGAYFLGYSLGALSLQASASAWHSEFPLETMALIFFVPLVDLALTIARRTAHRQRIMDADRQHIHHRLQSIWGTWPMLACLYGVTAVALGVWVLLWWR